MATHKYKKGDRLVYPHHGACTVEKIEKMTAFDVKQDYLKLKVAYTDLILMVPVANAESVGLREVINDEEVEEVIFFRAGRKKAKGKERRIDSSENSHTFFLVDTIALAFPTNLQDASHGPTLGHAENPSPSSRPLVGVAASRNGSPSQRPQSARRGCSRAP